MNIREMQLKDVPLILEWMSDQDVLKNFKIDANNTDEAAVIKFVENSQAVENKHFSIVDDNDEYVGTVSLKNININSKNAEYVIVIRSSKQGQGYGKFATKYILNYAFTELGLQKVYLSALAYNKQMIELCKSIGFKLEGSFENHIFLHNKMQTVQYYGITKAIFYSREMTFNELGNEDGKLVVIEGMKDIPFEIKRIFYIYGTKNNVVRGQHANAKSEFMLINVRGKSKVKLIYTDGTESIYDLDAPNKGVYIPNGVWKNMYDFSDDSILLVLASEHYDAQEYISNFDEYLKIDNTENGEKSE